MGSELYTGNQEDYRSLKVQLANSVVPEGHSKLSEIGGYYKRGNLVRCFFFGKEMSWTLQNGQIARKIYLQDNSLGKAQGGKSRRKPGQRGSVGIFTWYENSGTYQVKHWEDPCGKEATVLRHEKRTRIKPSARSADVQKCSLLFKLQRNLQGWERVQRKKRSWRLARKTAKNSLEWTLRCLLQDSYCNPE